jgi:hypothetical protein
LPSKVESPPYTAVTEVLPTGSIDVLKVAWPLLRKPVPSVVVPLMNDTVSPSGGAPPLDETVAAKITVSPSVDGFGEEARVVVVFKPTVVFLVPGPRPVWAFQTPIEILSFACRTKEPP